MKQLLLFFSLFLCFSTAAATHIKGGFITYVKDSGANPNPRKFHFTLTEITDPASSAEDAMIRINMGDGADIISVPRHSITAVNPGANRAEFKWEYTFGADGTYTVSWMGVNRNPNILNVAAPSADLNVYIATTLNVNSLSGLNSSPQFLAPESIVGSIGVAIHFNLLAYDPDGDSLAYKLVTPLMLDTNHKTIPVPGYSFPGKTYSCGSTTGASVSVFEVDSLTGQVTWDAACRQGEYVIAIVVEEWRGKRKMGEVLYDMQILTTFEPQARINLDGLNDLKLTKEGYVEAKINQELSLKLYYTDLTPTGAPIPIPIDENAPAEASLVAGELSQVFNTPVTHTLEAAEYGTIATFRFTPDSMLIRNKPYFMSFYGKKNNYYKTYAIGIKVRSDQPVLSLNGESNLPKTPEGHLIAATNKSAKYIVFAENMAAHTLTLSVESTLAEAAEQFQFTTRDSADGKVGELLFIPSEAQINSEPQTIIFKAIYSPNIPNGGRLKGSEPIIKEIKVQVVVLEQKPNASPNEIAIATSLIYPNPVHNNFFVKVEKLVALSIHSLHGKLIWQQTLLPGVTELKRPATIKSGIYIYSIIDNKGDSKTGKLIFK